ncbi:MAG: hypothetical protein JWS12_854 [Candidatus Saccharibacteria bacterium]|nr:hypothetical protein [Candidatus Saccharibacteria bacterium]
MADSLHTLLQDKNWAEPAELKAIKDYIKTKFDADVTVGLQNKDIVIIASGGSLAGTLRLYIEDIRQAAHTTKKIIIRIG